jgi:hypothetical protein
MEYIEALKVAKAYYSQKGAQEITKALETSHSWIFFGGAKGKVKIGGSGIIINKETGVIEQFILPSRENFELLKEAIPIEFD